MNQRAIGVYRIVSPGGSCYVGATTVAFEVRWKNHLKDFRANKTKCLGLRRAFAKYGIDGMRFEILEIVDLDHKENVWALERRWWNRFKAEGVNLYNGEPTGTGSVRHTDETKSKIGNAVKSKADAKPTSRRNKPCKSCGKAVGHGRERLLYCENCAGTRNRSPLSEGHKQKISKSLAKKTSHQVNCKNCKKKFEAKRKSQMFCSRSCIAKATNKLKLSKS